MARSKSAKKYRGSWLLASASARLLCLLPVLVLMWLLTAWAWG